VRYALCLFAFLLLGNAAPQVGEVPDALKSYIVDGELKTDDFGWMRGAFDGATEQQKAEWQSLSKWAQTCGVASHKAMIAELAAMGIATQLAESGMSGSTTCLSFQPFKQLARQTRSWQEFVANEAKGREIFKIYRHGARVAAQNMPYEKMWGSEDAWTLMGAPVQEQVYRMGFSWEADENAPKLDSAIIPYLNAHLGNAVRREDHKNTDMLKKLVAEKGWPTISSVGQRASGNAWLLVQHADHDPAFQLKALRLMEPLVATGEVSKRNYAYLYDRIMLKLTGKQRFGTQFGKCEKGIRQLRPLEDEKQLDDHRKRHDLEPIAEYRRMMDEAAGPCPAA
jgi:hypothetical protein